MYSFILIYIRLTPPLILTPYSYLLDDSGSLVGDQTAAVKEFALLSARVGVRINPEVVRSFNDVFVRKAGGAAEIDEVCE